MFSTALTFAGWACCFIFALIWMYIAARLVSRAIVRTLNEHRKGPDA